jgi:DNA adenine methylase
MSLPARHLPRVVSDSPLVGRPKPFLKWAGGKTQLLPEILGRFPKKFGRYHEPFLGGGAVFFALAPERAALSDVNADLVETYRAIRDDVESVIMALKDHESSAEHFYEVRSQQREELSSAQGAARTIFLNRTCFNGLYRVNRKGEFNVPFGKYLNPTICNEENLHAVSNALQNVDLKVEDALLLGTRVVANDLVYFDPPYDPVSKTASFTSYAKNGFGELQQRSLAKLFASLAKKDVHVMLSNSDTPLIWSLYKGFKIERVYARRAINSKADRRGHITELLISND